MMQTVVTMPADQTGEKSRFLKFFTTLFFLLCGCGLIWQLWLISEMYFGYKVTTSIQISIPDKIHPVSTSFCTRFTDVLDFDRLNKDTGYNWTYSLLAPDIQKYQDELTVNQIFAYTPAENQTIGRIVFREDDSYERIEISGNRVYDYFEVRKYVNLEHICYRFHVKRAEVKSYSFYAVTPTSAGMIYEVFLSPQLSRSDPIKVCMHQQHTMPYRSLKIEPVIWRQYDPKTGRARYSKFTSFQIKLISQLLPPPYETNCHDYSPTFASDAHCVQTCVMERSIAELGLVPFSALITESAINETMISVIDLRNQSLVQKLLHMEDVCKQVMCKKSECDMTTTMTTTMSANSSDFGLKILVPSMPWITVTSNPCMDVIEFLTYVMSAISTWTGLSVMSFMPSKLIKLRKSTSRDRASKRDHLIITNPGTQQWRLLTANQYTKSVNNKAISDNH